MTLIHQITYHNHLLWTNLGKLDWSPAPTYPTTRSTFPAKRHHSPLDDLRHAETQRRSAALRRGPMRTALYSTKRWMWFGEMETQRTIRVPLFALLVPPDQSDLDALREYCHDQNMRVDYIPWQRHRVIVCRNAADQMMLKIVFPYLC